MDYTIKFTTTPKVCRTCDQWDLRRRQCRRAECQYTARDYLDRRERAARADERRAAN